MRLGDRNTMVEIRRFGADISGGIRRPLTAALGIGGAGRNILTSMTDQPEFANMKFFEVGVGERLPELPFMHVDKLDMYHAYESKIPVTGRPLNHTEDKIMRRITGTDIVYVVAGMGGETGSWTAYSCAQIGQLLGAFTIALVALPFNNESTERQELAREAKDKISKHADVTGVFHNSRLLRMNPNIPMTRAFEVMNTIIQLPMREFNTVITDRDIIHLKRFCNTVDEFRIGAGYGKGRERGKQASLEAFRSPWLDDTGEYETVLTVVTSGTGSGEMEAQDALDAINEWAPGANIMWGLRKDPMIGDRTRVTLLAGIKCQR